MDSKNFKIVKIKGGLGNQLFQYSFALYLKENYGLNVLLDISWFKDQKKRKFILPEFVNSRLDVTELKNYSMTTKVLNYRTEGFFTRKLLRKKLPPIRVYDGYWQNKVFAEELKKKDNLVNYFSKPIVDGEYYFIHVRGTDFKSSKTHNIIEYSYYLKNLKLFSNKKIFALTDDLNELNIINEKTDINFEIFNGNEKEAFNLIMHSNGGILSNSTFCWWPVFLSNKKNIIQPYNWLKSTNLFDAKLELNSSLII